jgi:hypothetical protein
MKLRKIMLTFFTALAFFATLNGSAFGTASTHIWGPSTDIQAFKTWHVTCDLYIPDGKSGGNRLYSVTNLGLTVGILPFKNLNAEIGFDHKSGLGVADDYPMYYNFKLGVPENSFGTLIPAVAVGAFDIGTKSDVTDYNVFYGKVAKTFNTTSFSLGRISMGYFSGNEKLLLTSQSEKDNSGVMVAWERTMTELSDKFWICLEYMGTESAYGCFNVGASWKFAPNVAILGGYDIYNDDNFVNTATLQVDIDF